MDPACEGNNYKNKNSNNISNKYKYNDNNISSLSLCLPTFISLSPFSFLPPSYPNIYYNTANPWSVVTLRYFNPVGSHPTGLIGEDPNGIPNNLMPYVSQVSTYKSERTMAEI